MKKMSGKSIMKSVKDKEADNMRSNYTFRLNVKLMNEFKEHCRDNSVSMASVIEEILRQQIRE